MVFDRPWSALKSRLRCRRRSDGPARRHLHHGDLLGFDEDAPSGHHGRWDPWQFAPEEKRVVGRRLQEHHPPQAHQVPGPWVEHARKVVHSGTDDHVDARFGRVSQDLFEALAHTRCAADRFGVVDDQETALPRPHSRTCRVSGRGPRTACGQRARRCLGDHGAGWVVAQGRRYAVGRAPGRDPATWTTDPTDEGRRPAA